MSVSHCIDKAGMIAITPLNTWAEQVERLPQGCSHADCGPPRCCRERIAEYLRVQYRIHARMNRIEALRRVART